MCAAPRALRLISAVAALSPARCVQAALTRRLPPPGPQPAPHRVCPACAPRHRERTPSTRTSPAGTPRVSRTCARCLPCAAPRAPPANLQSHPLPCGCVQAALACRASRLPARSPPRTTCALLASLGSTRSPSTSRCAGTPPATRPWTTCLTCAPLCARPPICTHGPSTLRAACAPRSCPDKCTCCLRPSRVHTAPTHTSIGPSFASAVHRPVRRQQAAHQLRVGGHPRLLLLCLWPRR